MNFTCNISDELEVLELTAWNSHAGPPSQDSTQKSPGPVTLQAETKQLAPLLTSLLNRSDLHQEFADLAWRIAVVDLRTLQAFQRRLVFDPANSSIPIPSENDWPALIKLAFGPPRSTTHEYISSSTIQSENPDLHLRETDTGWKLHGGSPFFEVALYNGRAFLRDGYHRAYALLATGVFAIPAVVIEARSMAEVYFDSPNFFPESILFGPRPPMVTDFLNLSLTSTSTAPRIFKTIHLPAETDMSTSEHTKEYQP